MRINTPPMKRPFTNWIEVHFSAGLRTLAAGLLTGSVLLGCAAFNPQPLNERLFREQATVKAQEGVRVRAAVLSAQETQSVFGLSLYKKGIQPVWLEIENNTRHRRWFAPLSVDRDYFSPMEVAYMHHGGHTKTAKQAMDRFFLPACHAQTHQSTNGSLGIRFHEPGNGHQSLYRRRGR